MATASGPEGGKPADGRAGEAKVAEAKAPPAADKAPKPDKPADKGQGRQSVSAILSSVQQSQDRLDDEHVAVGVAILEVAAIAALHLLLLSLLQLPAPEKQTQVNTFEGARTRHVWLAVTPRCWTPPDWDNLFKQAQDVNSTGKVSFVGTGEGRHLRLDGLVDPAVATRIHAWARGQRAACLTVEKAKEDYALLAKARWTPTPRAAVERAAHGLSTVHARIRRALWEPEVELLIESTTFPGRAMAIDEVERALVEGGLRDFRVEPVRESRLDAQARADWQRLAVVPVVKAQRGALAVQVAVYAALVLLWLIILRGRFARAPARETLPLPETLSRLGAGVVVALIATIAVVNKIGVDVAPLQALVPEPDRLSSGLAIVAHGIALPIVHSVVVLGYAERRLAEVAGRPVVIAVMAVLFTASLFLVPAVPPLSVQSWLWLPVAAIAGWLVIATARLSAGTVVAVIVQVIIAATAFL